MGQEETVHCIEKAHYHCRRVCGPDLNASLQVCQSCCASFNAMDFALTGSTLLVLFHVASPEKFSSESRGRLIGLCGLEVAFLHLSLLASACCIISMDCFDDRLIIVCVLFSDQSMQHRN